MKNAAAQIDTIHAGNPTTRYMEDYVRGVGAFSPEDHAEHHHWLVQGGLAGSEAAHLFPFRPQILLAHKSAGLERFEDMQDRLANFPFLTTVRAAGFLTSQDGMVSPLLRSPRVGC